MNIQFAFPGSTVVVTGASGGIGKGVALAFGKAGANIVIGDLKEAEGNAVCKELEGLGAKTVFVKTDVTSQAATDALVKTAIDTFGGMDVLVNSAGVSGHFSGTPITGTSDQDFDITYSVNLKGIYHTMKSAYPYFVEKKDGRIINVTSVVGHSTNLLIPHYAASKAAALNLTFSMAKELGPYNITVNSVCPGYIHTPIYENAVPELRQKNPAFANMNGAEIVASFAKSNCALGRVQTEEDQALAVMFLASDAGKNITGIALDVAGGYKL